MKYIIAIFLLATTIVHSQAIESVSWKTKTVKISDEEYDLIVEATIEPNYHLYSQTVPDNGPLPTVFSFKKSKDYKLIGKVKEESGITTFDPVFEMEIKSFHQKAIFKQRIKIKNKIRFKIRGEITFMSCNDKNCIKGNRAIEFEI